MKCCKNIANENSHLAVIVKRGVAELMHALCVSWDKSPKNTEEKGLLPKNQQQEHEKRDRLKPKRIDIQPVVIRVDDDFGANDVIRLLDVLRTYRSISKPRHKHELP